MDILNKSKNFYRCVGSVYEKGARDEDGNPIDNFMPVPGETTVTDKDGNKSKVKCQTIRGNLAVRAGENGIITFPIWFNSIDYKGEENPYWKMALGLAQFVPEIGKGRGEPTNIVIEGTVSGNMFPNNKGEIVESTRFYASKISTKVKPGSEFGMTLNLSGCMTKNVPETKMVDGEAEETGRGVMTVYMANNKGEVFPVNIIVPEDIVDDVNDAVENGCTVDATVDVNVTTSGGMAKKHGIGRAGKIDTSNVSTRTEFVLAGMDIVDEPDELYIEDEDGKQTPVKTLWMDSSVVKKAIKMYQVKKDEFAKNGGNKAAKSTTPNLKDKKAEYKSKRVGKKATNDFDDFEEIVGDDLPFDEDEF